MITPARQQYLRLKAEHPDAILLYRLGDFYETFDEDAHTAAQVLGITLTSRSFGRAGRVPMAGIPHHALTSYLRRLLRAGLRIAICEQMTEPGRGLVEREVVRVLSPGTIDDPTLLDERRANTLLAVARHGALLGMAWVDVSTGSCEYHATPADDPANISAIAEQIAPSEIVAPDDFTELPAGLRPRPIAVDPTPEAAVSEFASRFPEIELPRPAALLAVATLFAYLRNGQTALLDALEPPLAYAADRIMVLDRQTRQNLEIDLRSRDRRDLFALLDQTRTAPGARLLRAWLNRPLVDRPLLEQRLDAVEELHTRTTLRHRLGEILARVRDLERLATRVRTGAVRVAELSALHESLVAAESIRQLLDHDAHSGLLRAACIDIDSLPEIRRRIEEAVDLSGVPALRPRHDARLSALHSARQRERAGIVELERIERERTGVRSLKAGHNKVFGYYFEVTRAHRSALPEGAERKQSLSNAERYTTPALAAAEQRLALIDARVLECEAELYGNLIGEIAAYLAELRRTAAALAVVDVVAALARVAAERRYVRPVLTDDSELRIVAGRHPMVERELPTGTFVPNDAVLDDADGKVVILTGPNMAGKSTWLRQVALIVLLAQVGSFVPADHAEIGLVDRIFTRIGAHDDLARGQSTFMVEMLETATILNCATERSLIVLDEIGRGTGTEDGIAIATAVMEHLATRVRARTLFATHFREIARACERIPAARPLQTAVRPHDGGLAFLHAIVPGVANATYGLEIARMAGLPADVISRAQDTMLPVADESVTIPTAPPSAEVLVRERVAEGILSIDIATTTPLDALIHLANVQKQLRAAAREPIGPRALEAAEPRQEYGRAD